ncbi:MAG: ester cyclase [Bacteroidota bacterium]
MKTDLNQENKKLVWSFWKSLEEASPDSLASVAEKSVSPNCKWFGFDPVNQLQGIDEFIDDFWLPLKASFPDLRRDTHLFMGGESNGRIDGNMDLDNTMWVSATGYFHATFEKDYLNIPATGSKVNIRWGEFCKMKEGKISEAYFLLDLIDLIQQAGFEVLPPSKGKDGLYPPPAANDGVMLTQQDEGISAHSLEHIRKFIFEGLNVFDQEDLKSMGMAGFFHPKLKWYGPGGIGACLNFKEFEDFHQKPWLKAFPDRSVQNLDALIAEGNYSGGSGWAGVKATHTGPYLDCVATGRSISINGLDWWKRDGEVYVENWVFVDMIHLFRQFGIDLLEKLQHMQHNRVKC